MKRRLIVTTNTLEKLSRADLAQLGREYMLTAQFNSRTGYVALQMHHGQEAYLHTAIDNWMAASPVYTQRMQRAMHLTSGSDIATILKGLQLDCGMSHQYFDAGFQEVSATEGLFWLNSCGPLLETEPRGEAAVRTMCHDIEDPTFDATAVATNPRARVIPVHRPPRVPQDRTPHCKWRVVIDPDATPIEEREITGAMRRTALAQVQTGRPGEDAQGGLEYYDGPVFETLQLERFSRPALVAVCKELAIQIHLLVNSLSMVVAQRYGRQAAAEIAQFQMTGSGWVVSERLARCLGHPSGGIDAVVDVLCLHPAFQPPEYFGLEVEKLDKSTARVSFGSAAVEREEISLGWFSLLRDGYTEGLEAMARGIDRSARIVPVDGREMAWDVVLEPPSGGRGDDEEPLAVQIAKGTVLYTTKLEGHLQFIEVTE